MLRYAFGAKGGESCGFSKIIIRKKTQHIVIQKSVIPFRLWGTILLFCLLVYSAVILWKTWAEMTFRNAQRGIGWPLDVGFP